MFMPENLHRVISAATLGFAVAVMVVFLVRVVFQIRNAKPELYLKPHI
jgi:hypothetical protein